MVEQKSTFKYCDVILVYEVKIRYSIKGFIKFKFNCAVGALKLAVNPN